jgi:hypothetical protein
VFSKFVGTQMVSRKESFRLPSLLWLTS